MFNNTNSSKKLILQQARFEATWKLRIDLELEVIEPSSHSLSEKNIIDHS